MKNLNFTKLTLTLMMILGIVLLLPKPNESSASISENKIFTKNESSLSFQDSVKMYLQEIKMKYPKTVFKQALLETRSFTSDIFKENNNLFGLKVPTKRATLAIGENRNHAVFKHWKDSVIEYALLQSGFIRKIKNKEEYLEYLDQYYSELPGNEYSKRLRKFEKSF